MSFQDLIQVVSQLGFPVAISTYLVFYLSKRDEKKDNFFMSEMKNITNSIQKISQNIGNTVLNKAQTTMIFDMTMNAYIDRKIDFLKVILEKNKIKERVDRIKENIKSEFIKITKEEAEKLSSFNTHAGDLGLILLASINWEQYLCDIYSIFFSEENVDNKLYDIKGVMKKYKNNVRGVIEDNIRKNQLY